MIVFVTGTDTGVGKTIASAWLASRAIEEGRRVRYVKPVQTGCAPGEPGADADVVARLAKVEVRELLRFAAPLAPAAAAEREGRTIDVGALEREIAECACDVDLLIVEGAGGLLVPLWGEITMADLALHIGAQLVVVARPGLGTLNHTALTLEAAVRRRLDVSSIIVSGWPAEPGQTERTNLARLRAHGLPVVTIPLLQLEPPEVATSPARNR